MKRQFNRIEKLEGENGFKSQKGFTIIELLTVVAIIGILAAIAIPVFAEYKARAYDSETKGELYNIFLACKGYWTDNGSSYDCAVSTVSNTTYGYVQPGDMTVTAAGNENTFSATITHNDSGNSYSVNSQGNIS